MAKAIQNVCKKLVALKIIHKLIRHSNTLLMVGIRLIGQELEGFITGAFKDRDHRNKLPDTCRWRY